MPDGPLAADVAADLDALVGNVDVVDVEALERLGRGEDPRVLWEIADVLRFYPGGTEGIVGTAAASALSGLDLPDDGRAWDELTDQLLAWDLPAGAGHAERKSRWYSAIDPRWGVLFGAGAEKVDWRPYSWGGVLIDDRGPGDTLRCTRGCIPALDDPATTDAAGGRWYPDERIVFGVTIGDVSRAYPKNVMEVHEMVNDTIDGRRLALSYCTLCGSAQAHLTDRLDDTARSSLPEGTMPVMRTSGLLARSNKVMYELRTGSMFDTFTGEALTGPLAVASVILPETTVVTSTWAEWRTAHPDTTIIAEDGGVGRAYPLDPLRGRDDDGPIFPIGNVDARLPVQEQVVGVVLANGDTVAFRAETARRTLASGDEVTAAGVTIVTDAGGLRAVDADDLTRSLPSHEAFWFAWSQFHPGTVVWPPNR